MPGAEICLRGIGTSEQVTADIRPFEPLTEPELALLAETRDLINRKTAIACISCRSCEKHCPQNLQIARHMQTISQTFET